MSFENRKVGIINPASTNNKIDKFTYERSDGLMANVMKYDWDGYALLSENGSRLLFQFDGYAFLDSCDTNSKPHYWIGVSYWNKERPDTFFELELESFYQLIAMYLNENDLPQFYEELSVIEFAGQLLDHMNRNAG